MRKPFLDNLRHSIVLLVVIYHIFYQFNSVGVITNVVIPGIPVLDVVEYVLYPWFMVALFLISGICARYSLQKQTHKEFLKSKVRHYLIPSIAGIFIIGWMSGWVTAQYIDMFGTASDRIPGFVKYLIWGLSGIGVLWFLHQLILADLVLVLIRKIDKKDRLWQLGGKANILVLCLMVFALWGSAQILNTPVIEIHRNGIYTFAFLAGYCVFSHERVQELLAKWAPVLLAVSGVLAVVYVWNVWGENYTTMSHLKEFLTNAYAWFATLAVLGAGKRWMDRETKFTRYMASRSFGFYVLHYPLMTVCTWYLDKVLHLPVWSMYLILPVVLAVVLPVLVAMVKKVPVLRRLLLGER